MIRHSSSFFASLIIHSLLAFALFLGYQNYPTIEKKIEKVEEKVCIALCDIHKEHPKVEKVKKVQEPKKEIKPPPPKPKPKPIVKKPKPKVKKKVIPKKVIPKKIVPLKKAEPKPKEEAVVAVEEVKEISVEEEEPMEIVLSTDSAPQESQDEKEVRLEHDYLQEHLQKISQLLKENLYYPRSARRRGIVGQVLVKFTLSTDGIAHSISITTSKSEVLSRSAITTIENLSGKFPKPQEELILHVPINYRLR